MCADAGSDASDSSEASEASAEVDDTSAELCENENTSGTTETSTELVEQENVGTKTEATKETELVEQEKTGTKTEATKETELVEQEKIGTKTEATKETEPVEDEKSGTKDVSENEEVNEEAVRAEINEKSNYSKEVNDNIRSVEELEHYQSLGLREETIDGKTCLIRDDIDWDQKDEFGHTNAQRVENGNVPINKSGEKVELHHIGQKDDSPLAELTFDEHRSKGIDTVLHDKTKESEIDRPDFTKERVAYWKSRNNNR